MQHSCPPTRRWHRCFDVSRAGGRWRTDPMSPCSGSSPWTISSRPPQRRGKRTVARYIGLLNMADLVVSFGEIMLRLAPPGFERFLQSPQFVATFGGGEANVAVSIAQFGHPAAYATFLPPDNPIADAVVSQLRSFGVDTSKIVRAKGRMPVYYVENGANQ